MRNYRTFDEIEEAYFRKHPEEIDDYVALVFDEYAKDADTGALLSSLRTVSRAKGITAIAEETGMTRKGVQKALSENGNPRFESIMAIMQAIGYRLAPQKLESGQTVV